MFESVGLTTSETQRYSRHLVLPPGGTRWAVETQAVLRAGSGARVSLRVPVLSFMFCSSRDQTDSDTFRMLGPVGSSRDEKSR